MASARSRRRLAMNVGSTPRWASACAHWSPISPVPRITTRRPDRSPMPSCAASTATQGTDPAPVDTAVSERTRLPVASAAPNMRLDSGPVVPAPSAAS
jgi:hypothetical protein